MHIQYRKISTLEKNSCLSKYRDSVPVCLLCLNSFRDVKIPQGRLTCPPFIFDLGGEVGGRQSPQSKLTRGGKEMRYLYTQVFRRMYYASLSSHQ